MRRVIGLILSLCLVLSLCACGSKAETAPAEEAPVEQAPTWQEQYDLGVRYLSEGNYEEAIIAFTAAIAIAPKQPDLYTGRAQAYILSGENEGNLAAALSDFEIALTMDETLVEAWLGLADVYIRQGNYNKAMEVLKEALDITGGDSAIASKIAEMEAGQITDSAGNVRKEIHYGAEGRIEYIHEYQYNSRNFKTGWTIVNFDDTGATRKSSAVVEFDERGFPCKNIYYKEDGSLSGTYDEMVFNDLGQEIERRKYHANGSVSLFLYYYDDTGRQIRYEWYKRYEYETELTGYREYQYDETGRLIGQISYDASGNVVGTSVYE